MRQANIRNFCIVAHIDHGKSTLADRLIELTGTLDKRLMREQVLDTMDLERERGITIKLNAVRMNYHARNGQSYELNLIDTPGHVDFTYEVSRSLAACEGAILVVDASQGIQAQTLSNLFLALDAGLEIIPVLNKIDLPGAEPDRRAAELHDLIGADPDDILQISAKEGTGVPEVLEAVVHRVPRPRGRPRRAAARADLRLLLRPLPRRDPQHPRRRRRAPARACRSPSARTRTTSTKWTKSAISSWATSPTEQLEAGEVGYFVANVRGVQETRPGDTVLDAEPPRRAAAARAIATSSRWCSPACTRPTPSSTRSCVTPWPSCSSTTPRCTTSPRRRSPWASGSAAAFSACCTWRSCGSGCSGSSIST